MDNHTVENVSPAHRRFHLLQFDGLYLPVAFVFVTKSMHHDIMNERQEILDSLPIERRAQQQKILECYDPEVHAHAFQDIIGRFGIPTQPSR